MFRKMLDRINKFMYGRYGADNLFYAIMIAFLLLGILNNFIHSLVILILGYAIASWGFFRYLSRNIYKRREENRKFLAFWNKIKGFFTLTRDRIKDVKVCRYRRCKHCKSILRLPKKRGKHSVNCPRCKKSFSVFIIF